MLWLSPGCAMVWHDASAAERSEAILYRSMDLMIYRALDRRGVPVVVLTNLDEEGRALAGPDRPTDADTPRGESENCRPAAAPVPADPGNTAPSAGAGERVRVVVNQGGAPSTEQGQVEISSDDAGGTTIVINVNPPPRPEREVVIVQDGWSPTVPTYGGIVGSYRYPDHLYFLGYGPDISSPSLFSGLGLNAGNGYGVKTGASCGRGFDCMFGPSRERR